MAASLSDSALFMDMDLFKEEDDASLAIGTTPASTNMEFPASSLELVQLLAYDDDFLLDSAVQSADAFARHDDGSYNADDLSDGVTDDGSSDMASPPPTFVEDEQTNQPASPAAAYAFQPSAQTSGGASASSMQHPLAVKLKLPPVSPPAAPVAAPTASRASAPMSLVPSHATVSAVSSAAMLPFAFPVACFPPLNANLKRPLPDVMPNQPATSLDPVELKKSKRALRQMKNRESANRSRLRRKEQLTDLSVEVEELTKKQHELQNTISALRAENKSLQDQNSFLRSLVTMYSDPARAAALPPMPTSAPAPAASAVSTLRPQLAPTTRASLHDLESGHKSPTDSLMEESCDEEDDIDEDEVLVLPTPKKQRKSLGRSAATVSAASLGLCASVFGLTILTDSENGAAQSSYIRRPGRVLHSLPSTTADQGCSPSPLASLVERAWELGSSSWAFLTTSELAYGVFLNVLSFVVIMGLYHCFQQYATSKSRSHRRSFRWQNLEATSSHRRNAASTSAAAAAQAKRRSVSWQDVRVEAQHQHQHAVEDAVDASPVQVFT